MMYLGTHLPDLARCVCVCTICIDVKPVLFLFSLLLVFIGECGMIVGPHSTKLPQSWDTGSDQPSVPAKHFTSLDMARG